MTRRTEPSKARPAPQEQLVSAPAPIACTLDDTGFTFRMAEFGQLFRDALVGRDTTADGIRFRFALSAGVEDQIRDLARREQSCCPFFDFTIAVHDDEVWWDATVTDPEARPVLDDFFSLPERLVQGVKRAEA